MIYYLILMLSAILLTAIGQIFLKIGSKKIQRHFWDPYLNPASFTGYFIYLISTILLLFSFQEIPLKLFAALSALNFIFILIFSGIFLNEKISKMKIIAILLIATGVAVFNIP